ncbi:MAG: ORF6N domain-containing protein, partial [Candidatus Omnitrophota bacterium]
VKRNASRFPEDFMFQLTEAEKKEVIANCDHLKNLKFSPQLPHAFTEQGIAMLSSVLRSERAVLVNIEIMRTFVRLNKLIASHIELARKINDLEKKYDVQFKIVFDTLRKMLTLHTPPPRPKGPIGFQP